MTSTIYDISLKHIQLSSINYRSNLQSPNSQANLHELADSIKQNGLMQPVVLKGTYGQPPYDVVVGQRRFMAHQLLDASTIKASFTGDISDIDALTLSLSENLLRQELNHSDIMDAVTKLYVHYNYDKQKVKEKLGLSIKAITSYIKIETQATTKLKNLIRQNEISLADAKRAIEASQGDVVKADALIDEIVRLTNHEKTRLVNFAQSNPQATVRDIVKSALTPKHEERLILNLSFKIAKALKIANEKLQIDKEMIALDSLITWLKTNDYLTISSIKASAFKTSPCEASIARFASAKEILF